MDAHQLHFRDQHDRRSGANRLSPSQKVDENRLVDTVDWKPRKWMHRGSLSSGSSGLRHSNGPKRASCSVERDDESQLKTAVSLQSSSEKVADCVFSTDQSEGLTSKKKPRLGWGEGLAKYEKKKVEGPCETLSERGIEFNQSTCLDSADRTSGLSGALGSSSPATSSSLACSSFSGKPLNRSFYFFNKFYFHFIWQKIVKSHKIMPKANHSASLQRLKDISNLNWIFGKEATLYRTG